MAVIPVLLQGCLMTLAFPQNVQRGVGEKSWQHPACLRSAFSISISLSLSRRARRERCGLMKLLTGKAVRETFSYASPTHPLTLSLSSLSHLQDAQILFNMYCNNHMKFYDGTCCSKPEKITLTQIFTFSFFGFW